ncbi:MAG: hypothetical protein U1F54_14200 [Burkholderiales bacterium]
MNTSHLAACFLAFASILAAPPSVAGQFVPGTPYSMPDGRKITPGGYASSHSPFGYAWAVARTNADGSYDPTFSGVGLVTIPIFHYYEFASQVALQPDGKILVVGGVSDPGIDRFCYGDCAYMTAVARLHPDGSLDSSFNGKGYVVLSLGGAELMPQLPDIAYLKRFELGGDGRITIYGYPDAPAAIINADGTVDPRRLALLQPAEYRPAHVSAVEAYNAELDHYFMTWQADEIEALASGKKIKGWTATGNRIRLYTGGHADTSPVCRFYIPPAYGDSHFFGRGEAECAATAAVHPEFVLESSAFMHATLPQDGVCPPKTVPIYRVFNNRADANHRYTDNRAVRDAMVAKGWVAEGDGPDAIAMCGPK